MNNDRRILTDRQQEAMDQLDRPRPRKGGTPTFAGQVYDGGSMGSTAPLWYLTHPVEFSGAECEACPYTPDADAARSIPVIVLDGAPAVGDILIAEMIGGKWVAEKGGGGHGCGPAICVTGCPDGTPLDASVTVAGVGSCSTIARLGGCCSMPIPSPGTYSVSVSAAGYKPWSGVLTLKCAGKVTVKLLPDTAAPSANFDIVGCCAKALPGATVTISDGQSGTTDAGGRVAFWVAKAGTYTYTITGPCGSRFLPVAGAFTIAECVNAGASIFAGLPPAPGYICGANGPYPIPTTLHLTDSLYGACTLTYNVPGKVYTGTIAGASYPAQDYGPGFGGVEQLCPPSTFTITYTVNADCTIGNLSLNAAFHIVKCCRCFGGFPNPEQALVPSDVSGKAGACVADPVKCNTALLPQGVGFTPATDVITGWPSCPMDVTVTIPQVLCGGLPCLLTSRTGAPIEVWSNFGAAITITE
jgi:hypothetical protein